MSLPSAKFERCVRFCTQAADELIANLRHHGWQKWSDNYVRERVRCQYGEPFTNTYSPLIYREVIRRRTEARKENPALNDLSKWFTLGTLKD